MVVPGESARTVAFGRFFYFKIFFGFKVSNYTIGTMFLT
jgi:hypothetical protein